MGAQKQIYGSMTNRVGNIITIGIYHRISLLYTFLLRHTFLALFFVSKLGF